MINEAIKKLVENENLTSDEAKQCMNEIMSGEISDALVSAYLIALRMKGETIDEILGSAQGMRDNGRKLEHTIDLLEIVGTGGDRAGTFNVSTTSAFVAAGAGCKVAKHGNRGVSSKSGAADVLEALGADITIEPDKAKEVLADSGFTFLFAQKYHPAMKYVGPIRGQLGVRTIFNILGPLTNPASANKNVIGVYDEKLVDPIANVLMQLGVNRGMVVFGQDTMDEISASAKTTVCEIRDKKVVRYELDPRDYGFELCSKEDLLGGDGEENAKITRDILEGKITGPKLNAVLLNAAAAIYCYTDEVTYEESIDIARNAINKGYAIQALDKYVKATNA
ncbi:MAG: anthranilate phosphoribosyltransferase [Eubacterium sp.]|nr:anthranilate phosphoribosyltransferase [Eubacterium sp.]